MAITASVSLSQSTVTIHEPLQVAVTVSNSGGAPVTMNTITPRVIFTGDGVTEDASSISTHEVLLGPLFNSVVPAGGSTIFNFPLVVHAPSTGVLGTGTGTYSVNCIIYGADGSVTTPTAATLTVNPVLPIF